MLEGHRLQSDGRAFQNDALDSRRYRFRGRWIHKAFVRLGAPVSLSQRSNAERNFSSILRVMSSVNVPRWSKIRDASAMKIAGCGITSDSVAVKTCLKFA